MRICKIETCDKKHDSNGYCANHAQQFRRWGRVRSKDEWKQEIAERAIRLKPNLGKKWSKEAKQAQSEKFKGRCLNTGRTHFEKGSTPWNKGTKGVMKGHDKGFQKGHSPWNKNKKLPEMSGVNNPMWKGGVKSQNDKDRVRFRKFYQKKVLTRDNFTCQICDQYGGYLQVDHIKSWAHYPELRFDLDNCRTLCMACHYYLTFKRKLPQGSVWGHNLSRRIT